MGTAAARLLPGAALDGELADASVFRGPWTIESVLLDAHGVQHILWTARPPQGPVQDARLYLLGTPDVLFHTDGTLHGVGIHTAGRGWLAPLSPLAAANRVWHAHRATAPGLPGDSESPEDCPTIALCAARTRGCFSDPFASRWITISLTPGSAVLLTVHPNDDP